MVGIRGAAATRRASTACSMTVDKACSLDSGDWTTWVCTTVVAHLNRRGNREIRACAAPSDRVTSVTATPRTAARFQPSAFRVPRFGHLDATGAVG
ncbi:hypothetical protein GCM10010245_09010 [Streptomyces spectabilis]|nr:hypothetical protein GCM10010245_09010 [Streptomyces spectabilis]